MPELVILDSIRQFFTPNNSHVMSKVFGIAICLWPWPFKVKITRNGQDNIRNEFPTPQLVKIEVLHVYIPSETKKLDFHHSRWQPYLIWLLRHSCHYGGQAPRWFFMSRDPLTQFKWEIPLTQNCEQAYRPGTGVYSHPSSSNKLVVKMTEK